MHVILYYMCVCVMNPRMLSFFAKDRYLTFYYIITSFLVSVFMPSFFFPCYRFLYLQCSRQLHVPAFL